jgi:hypothetical protein
MEREDIPVGAFEFPTTLPTLDFNATLLLAICSSACLLRTSLSSSFAYNDTFPFSADETDRGDTNFAPGGSDLDTDGRGCVLCEQGFRIARQRPHRSPSKPEQMAPARLHLSQGKGMRSSVS